MENGVSRWRTAGRFTATPRSQLVAQRDSGQDVIGNDQICILSARLSAQFAGVEGNNYGRAGRIAGSQNIPAASLFDADGGTFLPLDQLRADSRRSGYAGGGRT
ncbi:hypothetical protein [Sodalis sp. RH19]|uniref:hypothetical protein n=1 Tax=Sodalis sp. RH19 TaxID=3394334 RepID=UPI0039B46072